MRYITLIRTAEELPTHTIVVTSAIEREYENVEDLIKILKKSPYVFAVHGKGHGIIPLERHYTSNEAVFSFLSGNWHTYRRPERLNFKDFRIEPIIKFIYGCGYDDRWYDKRPGIPESREFYTGE